MSPQDLIDQCVKLQQGPSGYGHGVFVAYMATEIYYDDEKNWHWVAGGCYTGDGGGTEYDIEVEGEENCQSPEDALTKLLTLYQKCFTSR